MYIQTSKELGQSPGNPQRHFVNIILIDPSGILKNLSGLREEFRSKLENKFNQLDPNWLRQANIRFAVQYRSHEPSNREKAGFGSLDFPVYLLGPQHGYRTIQDLMTQHKIPKTIKQADYYDLAKKCWELKDTRGCGIPSGEGFRKVGFIKTHRVFEDTTGDLWQAFVNVTAHEIGHMGNRLRHSEKGLMKYPVPLHTAIDFDNRDKYLFLSDLQRLKLLREATMRPIRELRWVFR